jgi:hypothetical protein
MGMPQISALEEERLRRLDASVIIEIDSNLDEDHFKRFLVSLLKEWVLAQDARNSGCNIAFENHRLHFNDEGGITHCFVQNACIQWCKMLLLSPENVTDDGDRGANYYNIKGVWFRDHCDGIYDVWKVHALSDSLEQFLINKGLTYKRTNRDAIAPL